jgi:hypothetical protein
MGGQRLPPRDATETSMWEDRDALRVGGRRPLSCGSQGPSPCGGERGRDLLGEGKNNRDLLHEGCVSLAFHDFRGLGLGPWLCVSEPQVKQNTMEKSHGGAELLTSWQLGSRDNTHVPSDLLYQ